MWHQYFPRSRPREAKGGIKAQSQRGQFGQSWWAKRWINVLESFNIGARLGRGRSYARQGQVLSIDIEKGQIKAKVQGSRPQPYTVDIRLKVLSDAGWKKLAQTLARQALFAAKLLAGEMPQDIEKAFTDAGLSLFPEKLRDLETECSCPDWSNPCKHIAAVYYLLGEEFDRDPFLLFKLRGRSREEVIALLSEAGASASSTASEETMPNAPASPAEPLSADWSSFWNGHELSADVLGTAELPPVAAVLPRRLGNLSFWRGEHPMLDTLTPIYAQAALRGMDVFLGENLAAKAPE